MYFICISFGKAFRNPINHWYIQDLLKPRGQSSARDISFTHSTVPGFRLCVYNYYVYKATRGKCGSSCLHAVPFLFSLCRHVVIWSMNSVIIKKTTSLIEGLLSFYRSTQEGPPIRSYYFLMWWCSSTLVVCVCMYHHHLSTLCPCRHRSCGHERCVSATLLVLPLGREGELRHGQQCHPVPRHRPRHCPVTEGTHTPFNILSLKSKFMDAIPFAPPWNKVIHSVIYRLVCMWPVPQGVEIVKRSTVQCSSNELQEYIGSFGCWDPFWNSTCVISLQDMVAQKNTVSFCVCVCFSVIYVHILFVLFVE